MSKVRTVTCLECKEEFETTANNAKRHPQCKRLHENRTRRDGEVAEEAVSEGTAKWDKFREEALGILDRRAPIPPIPDHIRATRMEEMGFDTPQEAVALFSDLHYGSRIDRRVSAGLAEYNIDLARERLTRWRNGILRFTQKNQVLLSVDTLHLMALGDEIEGHGQMFGSQGLQMSESAGFQTIGFAEDMTTIVLDLLERYRHITVYKVPGNHGRISAKSRDSYPPDNLEIMAWQIIADRVRAQCGGEWSVTPNGVRSLTGGMVDFYISPSFIMFLDILSWTFAIRHGHGIKSLVSTYTGAEANKHRLNAVVGEVINYYLKAHLHEAQSAETEIRGEIIQNGCFVGPSLLSVEMSRAAANLPSQELLFMHPRRGKTDHYRIHLADVPDIRKPEFIGRVSTQWQQTPASMTA